MNTGRAAILLFYIWQKKLLYEELNIFRRSITINNFRTLYQAASVAHPSNSPCTRHVVTSDCIQLETYSGVVHQQNITLVQCLVKLGQLFEKLEGPRHR